MLALWGRQLQVMAEALVSCWGLPPLTTSHTAVSVQKWLKVTQIFKDKSIFWPTIFYNQQVRIVHHTALNIPIRKYSNSILLLILFLWHPHLKRRCSVAIRNTLFDFSFFISVFFLFSFFLSYENLRTLLLLANKCNWTGTLTVHRVISSHGQLHYSAIWPNSLEF